MEIKRKIYNKILDWKNETNGKKALLVEGARRIGKSTVVEEFAQREYKSYILIDFNKAKKKVKDAFDDLEARRQNAERKPTAKKKGISR